MGELRAYAALAGGQFRSVTSYRASFLVEMVGNIGSTALDVLAVERIDHGNRALEDGDLVARLREERVPLTVCPLSNVALRCVHRLVDHPLRRMLDEDLVVTVNSDDPAYFGGYLHDNVVATSRALGLTPEHRRRLAENSFRASFLPEEDKARHLAALAASRL